MALDTLAVIAEQYTNEADALADFEAVRKLYTDLGIIDTYDAAVIAKGADGKVSIVKRVEEPTRQGGAKGLVAGMAVGLIFALFPAVTLGVGAGLLAGGALGASVGAIAGHLVGGMKRSDLKDIGEMLDNGTSGLVVIAASDVEAKVDFAIKHAKRTMKSHVQADADAIKSAIDRAA